MSHAKIKIAIVGSILLGAVFTAPAQLLNGSFESPVLSPPGSASIVTPDDWLAFFVGNAGTVTLFNGTPAGSPGPFDGQQYVMLAGSVGGSPFSSFEGLDQHVNIPVAGTYDLTWYAAGVGSDANFTAAMFDQNGNILNSNFSYTAPAGTGWNFYSLAVNLPAGNDDVQFGAWNNNYGFIDDVNLTTAPDSGSTLLLLNLAFGGLAACARKLRR